MPLETQTSVDLQTQFLYDILLQSEFDMTSSATTVEICNMALHWLGADDIASLTEDSERADLCELYFPRSLQATLEAFEWTFAVEHRILDAPESVAPTNPEWGQRFRVPTEWLRVLTVHPPTDVSTDLFTTAMVEAEQIPWVMESNYILCNYDEISVRAIKKVTTTTEFNETFVQCLAARLASDLAVPITNSLDLHIEMYALYKDKLKDALASEGMQGRSKRIRSRHLLARR